MTKYNRVLLISMLIIFCGGLLLNIRNIQDMVLENLTALSASTNRSLIEKFFTNEWMVRLLERADTCQSSWYKGFLEQRKENIQERNRYWGEAVGCNPDLVTFLYNSYHEDMELALTVHRMQPKAAESWFWLGDLKPENRLEYYLKGSAFGTTNGRHWVELGRMLEDQGDFTTALNAFLQACYHGDPGWNGCWSAGKTAEQLGDIEGAIKYYRLSRWSTALDRAKELESQLGISNQ